MNKDCWKIPQCTYMYNIVKLIQIEMQLLSKLHVAGAINTLFLPKF